MTERNDKNDYMQNHSYLLQSCRKKKNTFRTFQRLILSGSTSFKVESATTWQTDVLGLSQVAQDKTGWKAITDRQSRVLYLGKLLKNVEIIVLK